MTRADVTGGAPLDRNLQVRLTRRLERGLGRIAGRLGLDRAALVRVLIALAADPPLFDEFAAMRERMAKLEDGEARS